MHILTLVRTFIAYFCVGILLIICVVPLALLALLPERYRYDNILFFSILQVLFTGVIYSLTVPVSIIGKSNMPQDASIFIANHQSTIDIPAVGMLCGMHPHVWLVLEYYKNAPVLGFFIKRMFITVDQENPAKAARSVIQLVRVIKDKKRHVIIFPEGGRFIDGKVHDFYEGFAIIAKKTGHPVVPVYMPNNGKIYPPHSFLVHYAPLKIIVGEPMRFLPDETDESFAQRVYAWFVKQQTNK